MEVGKNLLNRSKSIQNIIFFQYRLREITAGMGPDCNKQTGATAGDYNI